MMRTTIDLPGDLHARAKAIGRDLGLTLSEAVALLMRRGIEQPRRSGVSTDERGWPVVSAGRPITSEDVRALDDDG